MDKEKVILIGSGQHARVVIYNILAQGKYDIACLLDADEKKKGTIVNGYLVEGTYDDAEAVAEKYSTNKFFIAFGNMEYRKKTFDLFISKGWEAINIIHPDAVISPDAKIGKGVLIECGCLITPNPIIGDNVVVNTGSQVNHDNVVENHVYIASGVVLSGGVTIHENTLLDDGVIVTLGRSVAPDCIVGAGAVVAKDITEPGKYIGVPARRMVD